MGLAEELYGSIHDSHKADATLSPYKCPGCGKPGRWRSGAEFEHEKLCWHCDVVWCPADVENYRELKAEEMIGMHGDGI